LSKFKQVEAEKSKCAKKVLHEWLVMTLWKKVLLAMLELKQLDL